MLTEFYFTLRKHGLKTSITEYLTLLEALERGVIWGSIDDFYQLSKVILVKDERYFDRFDRAFAEYIDKVSEVDVAEQIPEDWLNNPLMRELSEQDKQKLKQLGGLDELMKAFKERLKEQQSRHQGGNKWIGTGGTSPFGAYGYHPNGIRIGQDGNRNRSAAKVWDKREFRDLDEDAALEQRSYQLALRSLRQFARTGAQTELDLDETIRATSKKGGLLDLQWQAERHNAVNVLLLLDIGGSMDDHIYQVEQLFTALKGEFHNLERFYFHNCIYEGVWHNNARRRSSFVSTESLIKRFGDDYRLIIVGDATMGPYEIAFSGGSVEHWNEEPGKVWLERLLARFERAVWLNPQAQQHWKYYPSIHLIKEIMSNRMEALTLAGIQQAIEHLR